MKSYCHLTLSISSKQMSHTGHMSQMMHCLPITTLKMSFHIMLMSLNLHITLMSSLMTLHSLLNMMIHFIHVIHVKCLQKQVKTFEITFLIDMKLTLISVSLRQLLSKSITSSMLFRTLLSFYNHQFMNTLLSKQLYFDMMLSRK